MGQYVYLNYRGYAVDVTLLPVTILSGRGQSMGKSCCAIGCTNRYSKGCGLSFYRFPMPHYLVEGTFHGYLRESSS